jgi:hypothetical protein
MCTPIAIESATVGSFSQFGPFDPGALHDKEAGQKQRDHHFDVDADQQEDQRVDRGAREDRIVIERDITRRLPRQPQPVADRIDHEGEEHEDIGRQQHDAPDLRRRQPRRQGRCGDVGC